MRLRELFESDTFDLTSELRDLLYFLKDKGATEIQTELLLSKIKDGDLESLIDVLNTMPDIVSTANVDTVQLKTSPTINNDNLNNKEQSADKVAKMAKAANDLI